MLHLDVLMCLIRQYQWTFWSVYSKPAWILFFLTTFWRSPSASQRIFCFQSNTSSLDIPWIVNKQVHLGDKPSSSSLFSLLFGCCSLALQWKQKTSSAFINKRPVFLAFPSELENARCVRQWEVHFRSRLASHWKAVKRSVKTQLPKESQTKPLFS